ncbi:MAG TPA: L-lactate dehydrogenase [Chloroflexota bacterium]
MKVAMIGAGRVGSTTLFQLLREGFVEEMVVVDVDKPRAEGEALDLRHGLALARHAVIRATDFDGIAGADLVIITAGIPRKPGETRLDLLKKNVELMRDVLEHVRRYAPASMVLMVSNPVDVLTYQAIRTLGFPVDRVFGLGTVLDTTRFRSLLGERLGVAPSQVYAYMLGEHGDSMVPVLSGANVAGVPLAAFPGYSAEMVAEVVEATRFGGAEVIKRKGGTFYSVAPAIVEVVRAIAFDLKEVLPISSLMDGQLGLERVALSLPCVIGKHGRERVLVPPLSAEEVEGLRNSARILQEAAASVGL